MTAAPMLRTDPYQLVYDPSDGEDQRWYINDHTFVRAHDGTWHLFGITHAEPMAPHDERQLAHATAPSLLGPWTKQAPALHADLDAGETVLWAPHVIEYDGRWRMFVCAGGTDKTRFRIVLATSTDLFTWKRDPDGPLLEDGYEARDPMVLRVGDRWVMYYTATSEPEGGNHVVVATESADLRTWTGRTIVYRDAVRGTFGGGTESPFVVVRNGRFHLFLGPDWQGLLDSLERTGRYDPAPYRTTRVLVSDDPFSFDAADEAARIDSHAAEVVVDEHGDTWVSHCGWGQGGVWLARLHWEDPTGDPHRISPPTVG